MNISKSNLSLVTVESQPTIVGTTSTYSLSFTLYTLDNKVVEFTYIPTNDKLVGRGKVNGKTVAIRSLLNTTSWFNNFIIAVKANEVFRDCILLVEEGKFKRLKTVSTQVNTAVPTTIDLAKAEQTLYKALREYRYSNFNNVSLRSLLNATVESLEGKIDQPTKEKVGVIVESILKDTEDFLRKNPQFKGSINRGLVFNFLYKVSTIYLDKYKEIRIERKVKYTYQSFYNRLLGYLNFRTKQSFDSLEFRVMIQDFVHRERFLIEAEGDSLKEEVRSFYKGYLSSLCINNHIDKTLAIDVLRGFAAPSPSLTSSVSV